MVPAMYVDLAPDRQSCIWTPSMWLTLSHVVSMEVTLVMKVMVMENKMEFKLDMKPFLTIIPLILTMMKKEILQPIAPYLIHGLSASTVIPDDNDGDCDENYHHY